jgi:hypothetical protein
MGYKQFGKTYENIPTIFSQNIPIDRLGHQGDVGRGKFRRLYSSAKQIEELAIRKYRENGRGICFADLLLEGIASNKKQAQTKLKHYLRMNVIFTNGNHKPQRYYPSCLKSEILKRITSKSIPIGVAEVGHLNGLLGRNNSGYHEITSSDLLISQSLEGYVLPMLHAVPIHMHKIHLKLRIKSEYYDELSIPADRWNRGKKHEEIIGGSNVCYHFYANGTVMIFVKNSSHPFKLEDEADHSRILAYFGQIKDRLVTYIADKHERIVPDIMEWQITECDINKDIKVSDQLQITGLKIQVKHIDHLFRIYIKSLGGETVCRVEQSISNNQANSSILDTLTRIFNPTERIEKICSEISKKQDLLISGVVRGPDNVLNNTTEDITKLACGPDNVQNNIIENTKSGCKTNNGDST